MRRSHHWTIVPALSLGLAAWWCPADTVWVQSGTKGNAIAFDNVKVTGVKGQNVTFQSQSGRETIRTLSQIPRFQLDDEPVFSAAEEAFEKGDWAAASENYRKALQVSTKDWVKERSSLRLLDASARSGNFAAAVTGFLDLLQKDPGLANQHKPPVPKNNPAMVDPAIEQVKQASQNPKLSGEQKTVLLNYLVEMYTAKGDAASAGAVLEQLAKAAPAQANTAEQRHLQAEVKLNQARQAMAQKQYAQVLQIMDSAGGVFTEPAQQAEALYLLAEAKSNTAGSPEQVKDAALAYMRVAALFKNAEGKPHVADSLLKTAVLEEKLKNTKEAMALYNQVSSEFAGSPPAAEAQQAAARLKSAPQG